MDTNQAAMEANARLFITDLRTNSSLREAWKEINEKVNDAIQQAKQSGQTTEQFDTLYHQALQLLDNFLADHGYNTIASTVLTFLKSPFYEEYLKETSPNDDSDRFVQELMTNKKIFTAWQALLTQVAKGESKTTDLDHFLAEQGFHCTYLQINASFQKMRNHNMNYWAGSYSTILVRGENGTPQEGPTVVLYGNQKISINHDKPDKFSNKLSYKASQLTWKADMLTKYSGTMTFSEIALPSKENSYTGPTFTATLTYEKDDHINGFKKGDQLQLTGRLTTLTKADITKNIPASVDPTLVDQIMKWINYTIVGLYFIRMFVAMGKKYTSTKEFAVETNDTFQEKLEQGVNKAEAAEKEMEEIGRSPFTKLNFEGSSMLKDIEYQLDEATGYEKERLEQRYKEEFEFEREFDALPEEEASLEGEGWASRLKSLLEDVR
ncbi:hypothetical protein [Caldalkalibacillus mannanilyticus]|uniref:hypothetical protein n=1 Tax=Caldalkalibacillus mannanilyticus TaxID=1418 RepID=UPI0004696A65|nr:hypothetical protein [Caldalkalibacillus mannanilyticus]